MKQKVGTTIGLDIKRNVVRFVLLKSANPLIVKEYGEIVLETTVIRNGELTNMDMLIKALRTIFNEHGIKNNQVVFTALNQKILIRQLVLEELTSNKDIKKYLFLELGDSIPVPFEDPIFDLLISEGQDAKEKKEIKRKASLKQAELKKRKRKKDLGNHVVNFVATSEATLVALGDTIKASGNVPAAVDINSLGFTRAMGKHFKWDENTLLIEVDCGVATLTIFEEGVPVYVQYEDYNQINWSYSPSSKNEFDLNFDEAKETETLMKLAELVKNVLYFYHNNLSPGKEIERIYLVGENPLIKTIVLQQLQQAVNLDVEIGLSGAKDTRGKKIPLKYMLATGLAMKEV